MFFFLFFSRYPFIFIKLSFVEFRLSKKIKVFVTDMNLQPSTVSAGET